MKKSIFAMLTLLVAAGTAVSGIPVCEASAQTGESHYYYKIESDAEGWTWNGFYQVENDLASRIWEHGTMDANATGKYRFKGTSVEVYGYKGAVGGTLSVSLDGGEAEIVSLKADKDDCGSLIAKFEGLNDGWHEVAVTSAEEGKWHTVDYIRVSLNKDVYVNNYNLAHVGNILCSVPNPTGGGNRDLNVIRNEIIYPVGTSGVGAAQYDSFNGSGRNYFYMGYEYAEEMTFSKLVFQEGCHWVTGGWFADGDVKVQVRSNGAWRDVELTAPSGYPLGNTIESHGQSCEIFTFDFETVTGDAIRLIGMSGGEENLVSVSQIEVYADDAIKTLAEGIDYRKAPVWEEKTDEPGEDKPGEDKPGEDKPQGGCGSVLFGANMLVALTVGSIAVWLLNKKN